MRLELVHHFGVCDAAITVIPFGINNAVPNTALTSAEAGRRLGIKSTEKVILFFGSIAPLQGARVLVTAFREIMKNNGDYRLVIAGRPRKGEERYWNGIQRTLNDIDPGRVIQTIEYVPDDETEIYFKAADVSILPYTEIFQSGACSFV